MWRAARAFPNPPFLSFWQAAHWSPRRRASASTRRCRRSAMSIIAAPRACAPPPPTSSAWLSATSPTRSSPNSRSASRTRSTSSASRRSSPTPTRDPERQAQVLRSLREHNVAGIIMSPARGADAWTLAQQWPQSIPAVITMRRMIGSPLPYIGPDNRKGERDAVEHLLAARPSSHRLSRRRRQHDDATGAGRGLARRSERLGHRRR